MSWSSVLLWSTETNREQSRVPARAGPRWVWQAPPWQGFKWSACEYVVLRVHLKGKAGRGEGETPWLNSARKHSRVRGRSPDTVSAPPVFRTQLDVMSTSRIWQSKASWCEKRSTPLLLQKLLNTSCLNLLVSTDALLMKPAACLVLLRWFKHLVGNISVKFCTK